MTVRPNSWIEDVYRFWFVELRPEAWFRTDEATDAAIRQRFFKLYQSLAKTTLTGDNPREAVAGVIVLDQFPRNMFRGLPESFATDSMALDLANAAINAEFDRVVGLRERQFLYMPLQHSEDRAVQQRSVELFAELGAPDLLGFAEHHKAIIQRFGRFPHRNAILGRHSTPEEIEFLRTARPFN